MLCLPQHTASRFWSKLSLLCTCTSQWIKEEEVRYTTEIIIILHSSLYPCLFTEWLCSNSHKAVYVPTPWFHECLITSFSKRMHPKWHIWILNLDRSFGYSLLWSGYSSLLPTFKLSFQSYWLVGVFNIFWVQDLCHLYVLQISSPFWGLSFHS